MRPDSSRGMRLAFVGAEMLVDQGDEIRLRPGAEMGDHLRRRDRADAQALLQAASLDLADEEAGGEQIAGAGRVDPPAADPRDWYRNSPAFLDRDRAFGAASDHQQRHLVLYRRDRRLAVALVGEHRNL